MLIKYTDITYNYLYSSLWALYINSYDIFVSLFENQVL